VDTLILLAFSALLDVAVVLLKRRKRAQEVASDA
jgi:hypothetical protein